MASIKMTPAQIVRYRELMWIAQFGDFMSNTEYEELTQLIKIRNYQ